MSDVVQTARTPNTDAPTVAIFRDHLLSQSETFILNQGQSLERFRPLFIGSRRVPGIQMTSTRNFVLNPGTPTGVARETLFKITGRSSTLEHVLRDSGSKLVHAHFGPDGLRISRITERSGLPLIVTFHGFDATVKTEYAAKSFFGHRTYSRNKLTLGARAHCLIAVSKFIRNCLVDQGFHKDRIVIHYIGVDTDFFTPSQRIPRSKQVLYVGRLVEKKGPTLFIESIARLQAESPDVNAVMIGDGHLRSQIVALAQERRCQVRLLGSQPPQVVRDWMNRSRVLCFPSITAPSGDAEGFGLVLAEAQSMGLPVVAFASGGVPEAVIDRTSGLLFPEGDVQGLTHGLREMINRDDLFASMAQAGRENALKNFNLATQSRLLEDVYLRVIDDFAS